jgi:hypothetical protein
MWPLGLVDNAQRSVGSVVTNFYPTFSIITRAVDAASSADKVSSYENVTIRDQESAFIKRKQAIINLPPISARCRLSETMPRP